MTHFATMNLDEQQALLLQLACQAMPIYELQDAQVTWLTYSHNAVFDVQVLQGHYVLRLHLPGQVDINMLNSELQWLRVIRQQTNLIAPYPISAEIEEEEHPFIRIYEPSMPDDGLVVATLFDFLDGEKRNPTELTTSDVQLIGSYIARLHTAGQFTPPEGFVRPWLNWEGLFGNNSPYNPGEGGKIITEHQQDIFQQVAKRVQGVMEDVGQGADSFGLIHADLLGKNILFYEDDVRALDFEYSGWGYYLYDLTPLLWQLKGEAPNYLELEDALWEGYTAIRPMPIRYRDLLETFIAGRQLASCRWLAGNLNHPAVRDKAPELLKKRTQELEDFLQSGQLHRN